MPNKKPQIVIVGAGFGGLNAARQLADAPVEVILVDQNNYHLFQPLLYQVATAMVSPSEIAYPVRSIFRKQKNLNFRLTEMTGLDPEKKLIETSTGLISYDYLILAPGGETNYFNLDSVVQNGIGLKNLDDSIAVRNHILKLFELATQEEDPDTCRALRTFLIVGGGPTGVESAGALSELIRLVLIKDFLGMDFSDTRILILEMGDRLLNGFPENLAQKALHTLEQKHVEVRFGAQVTDYDGTHVRLKGGEEILTSTLIWAAGVRAVSVLDGIGLEQAKQGRVVVKPTLQVRDYPEIFVIGDAAYLEVDGKPLPMVAPVAIQQAKLAVKNIQQMIAGHSLEAFQYQDPGSLATIGRNAAVAEVKGFKFHGFLAWLVWLAVHLFWLIGFRNRLLVMINWAQDYIFYDRAERLITPDGNPKTEDRPWIEENVIVKEKEP
jgi:NADH:ubiquinone reductase (H+-translocating)